MKNKPSIMNYPGSKNESHFHTAFNNIFDAVPCTYTIVEPCIGGNGIQPFYYKNFNKYIISDYDDKVLNIYHCISTKPYDLLRACEGLNDAILSSFKYAYDQVLKKTLYNTIIEFIKEYFLHKKDREVSDTVLLIFKKARSTQNLSDIKLSSYMEAFKRNYKNILAIHESIYMADILKHLPQEQRDLLALVKALISYKDILLLIDPPYYLTDKIYNSNSPSYKYHKEFARFLRKTKGYFCLFLRINASRTNNSKDNEVLDDALFAFYKKFYYGRGYYVYCDNYENNEYFINYRSNGTLEVMITNFKYPNAYPLDEIFDKYQQKIKHERNGN